MISSRSDTLNRPFNTLLHLAKRIVHYNINIWIYFERLFLNLPDTLENAFYNIPVSFYNTFSISVFFFNIFNIYTVRYNINSMLYFYFSMFKHWKKNLVKATNFTEEKALK